MSSSVDTELPSLKLDLVHDDRSRLWQKSKEAFRYIYEYYRDKADWFLKADDDTFVIVENLRYMLQKFKPTDPIYFGSQLKKEDLKHIIHSKNEKFVSGGAGYVLSRNALTRLVNIALQGKSKHGECNYTKNMGNEDIEIGRCLESVDVHVGDTKDNFGRSRFHREPPTHTSYFNKWSAKKGMTCCSDRAISFHHLSPAMMAVLEYLIYDLKLDGHDSDLLINSKP
jgi:glycoprotein-N-acetylgalactosamine 3-beta-galactosyltransferase